MKLNFSSLTQPATKPPVHGAADDLHADLDPLRRPTVPTLATRYIAAMEAHYAARRDLIAAEKMLCEAEQALCEVTGPNTAVVCGGNVLHIKDDYWEIGAGSRISVLAVAG